MTTLEDILDRYVEDGHLNPRIAAALLGDCRKAARHVLHRCSHGEIAPCTRHRDPENGPGWINAIPVRRRS